MCRLRKVAFVLTGAAWTSVAVVAQEAADTRAQTVNTRCLVCHGIDLIEQQRLTAAAWEREIAKMIGWGAAVESSRAGDLAAYLAGRYAPRRLPSQQSDPGAAMRLLSTRCTVCHAADLIDAQRLDSTGWRRELTKMIGWGAVLQEEEMDLLVEHLAVPSR